VAKFKAARDPQGYNVVILDCAKLEAGKVLSEISASPFLAPKRMIVLENILSNSDKGLLSELVGRVIGVIPAKACLSGRQAGIQVAGSPIRSGMTDKKGFPESNIIVFYQSDEHSKVKEAKELDALLKKEKYAKEFETMSGAPLVGWIVVEVKNRPPAGGGKISASAAQYLATNVGGDMWHLDTLIDQLVAYCHCEERSDEVIPTNQIGDGIAAPPAGARNDKREITLADVQLFLDEKIDDNTFALTDAIVAGNHKLAFKLLNGQRALGAEDAQIFGAILWQFRVLMSMRDLYERCDVRSDEMAKVLKLHPFVVKKNLTIVKKYSTEKLKKTYADLLDIDIKTKTGFAEQELLMDLFVGRM
jgi:DNA polymerase III delta subunit